MWLVLFFLYNKQNNTWMLGNMKSISRVEQDISLACFAHIHRNPCIILYLLLLLFENKAQYLVVPKYDIIRSRRSV